MFTNIVYSSHCLLNTLPVFDLNVLLYTLLGYTLLDTLLDFVHWMPKYIAYIAKPNRRPKLLDQNTVKHCWILKSSGP